MGGPLVETEQDRSIRINDLSEVVVGGSRLWQAKQRLVPVDALEHVSYANDDPRALHSFLGGEAITTVFRCLIRQFSLSILARHAYHMIHKAFICPSASGEGCSVSQVAVSLS